MKRVILKVATVPVVGFPANVGFTTDLQKLTLNYVWTLQAILAGVDGSPTLTIKCSEDGVTFEDYKTESTNVDLTVAANRLLYDNDFPPLYYQVVYDPGGATVGTIGLDLGTKIKG